MGSSSPWRWAHRSPCWPPRSRWCSAGVLVLRFRDGTPYPAEDLFYGPAAAAHFVARCSRPGAGPTPGICLLERRLAEAADITVRFPRDWLVDWRRLSAGIDRLIASLRPTSS